MHSKLFQTNNVLSVADPENLFKVDQIICGQNPPRTSNGRLGRYIYIYNLGVGTPPPDPPLIVTIILWFYGFLCYNDIQ